MNKKEKEQFQRLNISEEKILWNVPMKNYTTFKIGGEAECLLKIDDEKILQEILQFAKENNIPLTILGNGSNVVISDEGVEGIVLLIQFQDIQISQEDEKIEVKVGAGYKIAKLGQYLCKNSIKGFEEISGIPGTIGGAIKMNAGAYRKEMKDIVKSVKCMDYDGNIREFTNEELEFSYRKSIFKQQAYIILEAVLELQRGEISEIKEKMDEYAKYRREHQPIEYPSAGSTFKRGEDFITAKLIDEAGLKGYTIGGAMVSTKHSGFIINKGNATAQDVMQLIKYIKEKIREKYNKDLELEIEFIGK